MLCRCDDHGWPEGTTHTYVAKVKPAGATNDAVICGRCETPGDIFLSDREYYNFEYESKRLYTLRQANMLQIRLTDSPEEVKESLTRDEDNPPEDVRDPDTNTAADW